jgi:hypothetical protein
MKGIPLCACCGRDAHRAAIALARALEAEDFDKANEIARSWSQRQLMHGLLFVVAGLLAALREHSEDGCDCGSDRWLNEWALQLAGETSS